MKETQSADAESVLIYLLCVQEALRRTEHDLGGGWYDITVIQACYAFFYTETSLLLRLDVASHLPACESGDILNSLDGSEGGWVALASGILTRDAPAVEAPALASGAGACVRASALQE
jgi:hypothetical protein